MKFYKFSPKGVPRTYGNYTPEIHIQPVLHSLEKVINHSEFISESNSSNFFPYKISGNKMIKKYFFLVCALSAITFAQQNNFNKEYELQKFVERGGKYEETSPNIYKLTNRDGTQKVLSFNKSNQQYNFPDGSENTIINVWEIDTTLYADRFAFWQRVDIVNNPEGIVFVDDINKNNLLELYGLTEVNWPLGGQVDILEQDKWGFFHTVYSYDNTSIFVLGIGDVNSDGIKEVYLRNTDTLNGKFYKADSLGALPTTFDFIFYYYPIGQINDVTFGDFDKNGITDCAFIDWPTTFIATYQNALNNFANVFECSILPYDSQGGFATGDFDQDEKTELVFGTALQQVYVIEAIGTNQYSVIWQGLAPSYNAYMETQTNDIDRNGKPEFWVGGEDFNTGISTLWCYESDRDNNYFPVAGIELRYLVSFYAFYLQAADMDNDGKEEIIISIGNYLLILKFTGASNNHSYEIWYAKIEEATQPNADFHPVNPVDFNSDKKRDLILPMEKYFNPSTMVLSYILVQDTVTQVLDENTQYPNNFEMLQNFPNPFNTSTQIKVNLKEQSFIHLSIYNLLGEEIKNLLDTQLPAGEYSIEWDGKNSEGNILNSGVYFITMKADGFQKTIKSVLLK